MILTKLLVGDLYMWKVQKPASHVPWTMDKINLQRAGCASNSWHFWSFLTTNGVSWKTGVVGQNRVPETDYRFSCLLQPIATPWVFGIWTHTDPSKFWRNVRVTPKCQSDVFLRWPGRELKSRTPLEKLVLRCWIHSEFDHWTITIRSIKMVWEYDDGIIWYTCIWEYQYIIWLVVTGTWMDDFSEFHHPNWLWVHHFFRGVGLNHQPDHGLNPAQKSNEETRLVELARPAMTGFWNVSRNMRNAQLSTCVSFLALFEIVIYIYILQYVLLSVHLYLGEYIGASYIFLRIPRTVWVGA